MKKLISATLAASLALSLAACGSSASTDSVAASSEAASTESTAASSEAAESTAETSELAGTTLEGRCLPHAPCRDSERGQGDSGRAGHRPRGC